jgi:hypothetical protein
MVSELPVLQVSGTQSNPVGEVALRMDWKSFLLGLASGGLLVPLLQRATEKMVRFLEKRLTRIFITPPESLQAQNAKFGLLHVRDGKDEVGDKGELLNKWVRFSRPDRHGRSWAKVRYVRRLGFQFHCYVDYKVYDFEEIKRALENGGYTGVYPDKDPRRAWFLVPAYGTCRTVDGFENNFFYPADTLATYPRNWDGSAGDKRG